MLFRLSPHVDERMSDPPKIIGARTSSLSLKILSISLIVVAGGVVFGLLAEDWNNFFNAITAVNPELFALSLFLGVLTNLAAAYFYLFLIKGHVKTNRVNQIFGIFLVSQIVRYIPGKIWSYAYQIASVPQEIPKTVTLLTNIEMFAVNILIIGGASLVVAISPSYLIFFSCVVFASIAVTAAYHIGLIDWLIRTAVRPFAKLGSPELERRNYHSAQMIFTIALWMTLIFASLAMAMHAIWTLSPEEGIIYAACLALSWIFIVPVGIGVRETGFIALSALMLGSLDGGQLAATAIIIRFWQLMIDVLSGLFGIAILLRTKRGYR